MYRLTILAALGTSVAILPVAAQDVVDAGELKLEGWSYEALYDTETWSIDNLFGTEVRGAGGDEIGDVEDFVLNDDGQIVALIAEVGGLWDIGDTHVSVPWESVEFAMDGEISIPVTEETVADFDLFATSGLPAGDVGEEIVEGVDNEPLGAGVWRASDLIGDYVRVQDEDSNWVNFGYVSDLLVSEGQVVATLVNTTATMGPGTYAYPYRRPGTGRPPEGAWYPDATTYDLPILEGDATDLPSFDESRMTSN